MIKLSATLIAFALASTQALAREIRCKEIKGGLREVILVEKDSADVSKLTAKQLSILGESQDLYLNFELTYFVGEAVPWTMAAVGGSSDVYLQVVSEDGNVQLTTFLDELGERDISSRLLVDGRWIKMSCK